jgi:hypothetical protein
MNFQAIFPGQAGPATWLTGSTSWAWIGSPATWRRRGRCTRRNRRWCTVTFLVPPGAPKLPVPWTLLAFADDPLDQLSTAVTSVHDLVLNDAHAAVRPVTRFG